MTETKFTPGPWKATSFTLHTGEQVMRIVPTDAYGIINRGPGPICDVFSQKVGIPDESCIANSKLIAAAPDLYEALELILELRSKELGEWLLTPNAKHLTLKEYAQVALAKARGEENGQG